MEKQKLVTASTILLCGLGAEQLCGEIWAATNMCVAANRAFVPVFSVSDVNTERWWS